MESYYTFAIAFKEIWMISRANFPSEHDTRKAYSEYLEAYKEAHSTPSQTDSLIVANLRAHLDELRKDYTSNEDGNIEYLKKLTSKISLLEEILSLQKPIV